MGAEAELLSLVDQLILRTEEQLKAAVAMDAPLVRSLSEDRADLVFQVQVALQDTGPLPDPKREPLAERVRHLAQVQDRLDRVVRSVLGTLEPFLPHTSTPANNYARLGRRMRR